MAEVLDKAQADEGMRFCMNQPNEVLGDELQEDADALTDSEGEDDGEADVDHDA